MKGYQKSDYATNKMNKTAIVYTHSDGVEKLTFEKVSESDPKITREEFDEFKRISDEIFHQIEIGDHKERNHKVQIHENEEYDGRLKTKSVEDVLFEEPSDPVEKIMSVLNEHLTPVEKERLVLHTLRHKKMTEIAREEGVSVNVVSKSIRNARKKLKEIFGWRG